MFSGKLASAINDEVKLGPFKSPLNSPIQFMGVPNNTPQHSPMESTTGSLEGLLYPNKQSPSCTPTSKHVDFQNQLFQSFMNKFPETNTSLNSSWINVPSALPIINLSLVEEAKTSYDTNCNGNSQNILDCNVLSHSRSFSELNKGRNSSFSDEISTIATCASDGSDVGSLSDFAVSLPLIETSRREQSLSLDDLQGYDKCSDFGNEQDLKLLKKASSVDDLQEIFFNFDE